VAVVARACVEDVGGSPVDGAWWSGPLWPETAVAPSSVATRAAPSMERTALLSRTGRSATFPHSETPTDDGSVLDLSAPLHCLIGRIT
jgi:hypothetical protein